MKTIYYFFVMTLISLYPAKAQTVSTYKQGTPDDAIILDADGNIYCSNFVGDTVFKFDAEGNSEAFLSGLNTPNGLAFNSAGHLYVCDFMAQTIYRYDNTGQEIASYAIAGRPSGIIKDKDSEDMIFTNFITNGIYRLSPDGVISLISDATGLNGPVGLAYDDMGNLFAGNYNDRDIYLVNMDGSIEYIANPGQASNLGFIAFGQGKLWGTVMGEHKIYQIEPYEVEQVIEYAGSTAGGQDGDLQEATFSQPNGILFDPDGETIYITDFGTKNLRIISDVSVLGIGTNAEPAFEVAAYPNPTKDSLQIELNNMVGTARMNLYDNTGRLLMSQQLERVQNLVQLGSLPSGVYLLELFNQGQKRTQKIVKQ